MAPIFEHVEIRMKNPATSLPFYKDLFSYLGLAIPEEHEGELLAVSDGHTTYYFYRADEDVRHLPDSNRDVQGLNHFAVLVDDRATVERFVSEFMAPRGITPEWGTPRLREDYGGGYFQVMFADPEGIAIEVFSKD